jgi:hypothetical protein
MVAKTIQERLAREPFQPFRIRTSGGTSYDVPHPHLVALLKSEVFIAAPNSDRWTQIPYLHIGSVEAISNGHSDKSPRRKRPR